MTGDDGLRRALEGLLEEYGPVSGEAPLSHVAIHRLRAILAEHPSGGWVSVKERLPAHSDPIFAFRPSLSFRQVTPLLFAGEFADDVTDWMPMAFPSPPRDGQEETK